MNKMASVVAIALLMCACGKSAPPAAVEPITTATPAPVQTAAPPAADEAAAGATSLQVDANTAPAEASAVVASGDQAVNDSIDAALGDHTRYQSVITQFQQAVAAKDTAAVAALVDYPFAATIDGKKLVIEDEAAFVAQYDRIMTPAIAGVIVQQKYSDLMVNYKGVMFGSGEAWVNGICKDSACKDFDVKVVAIQPAP